MTTPGCSGLQVEEQSGPDQSLARVGTARAAFVGRTLRGPVDHPILVKSFAEFQHVFGGLWQPSPLGYAVEQFFDNGGREALVVRVANGARSATLTLPAGRHTLTLRALRPGTREFIRASVDYDNAAVSEFNLTLQRVRVQGTEQVEDQEIFPRLALVPGAERYLGRALDDSELVRLVGEVPPQRPDRTLHSGNGLPTGYVYSNADGDDGGPLTDYDLIGSAADHTGLFALDGVDYFNFLCIPQLCRERDVAVSVWLVAVRYCKERRALLFIDPPAGWQTADDALRGMRHWNLASEHAVMYFPRLLVHDKLRGQHQCFAPSAAVAGMLARQDETAPVWSQPRLEDAILRPGYRPACLVSEDKRMRLAMLGVNTVQAVRSATRMGVHARTLAGRNGSADSQCLAVRRFGLSSSTA